MTKFVFVTGGVVSGLGKGITAASLGRLLKARGLSVTMLKFDPYLNVDSSNLSPYQQGEIFVTADGAEGDLVLGHYERILDENLYDNINLDTIAEKLSFSKTYIKSVFKKHTGTTIIQHYIDLKIAEAKKLLSQNKYTVTEIAFMLNFNSVHYFSRQFKCRTDMSPTEYIESIKADNVL